MLKHHKESYHAAGYMRPLGTALHRTVVRIPGVALLSDYVYVAHRYVYIYVHVYKIFVPGTSFLAG